MSRFFGDFIWPKKETKWLSLFPETMRRTRVIDVDSIKEKDKISVPVIDLEKNQQDDEIILVGEKRKNTDQQYRK